MDYRPETRAVAALNLTAELAERAHAEAEDEDKERRRREFLKVRPVVEAIARGLPHRRADAIGGLIRIAKIKPDAFEAECARVEAGWLKVMGEAEAFVSKLRGERRGTLSPTCVNVCRAPHRRPHGPHRCDQPVILNLQEPSPPWADVTIPEPQRPEMSGEAIS